MANNGRLLSSSDVRAIKRLREVGMSILKISKEIRVSYKTAKKYADGLDKDQTKNQ